jgi:hypothetical protein
MRDITKLLFGEDAGGEGVGKLLGLFGWEDGDDRMAERARRSAEWCGSTPGRGGGAADAIRRAARPGRAGRQTPGRSHRGI